MNEKNVQYTGLEIAVIGMAAQFPGSENISEFWNNLKAGNEGIKHLSKEELIKGGVDEETTALSNFVGVNCFLKNKEYFDNHFFNFTPHEAKALDPQIRVFFQTAWHALEDAGINPETYSGRIGLYAGARDNPLWQAYTSIVTDSAKVDNFSLNQYNNKEFISTLLSYKLNLTGPSVFMATACSTSLVAIHQAYRALLLGDTDICMAGGVSVASSLTPGYFHKEGMIMSRDGKCRTFDAESDGTVGGEGAGIVVLKRLKDALKDGDQIYAMIKGSAINNDGKRKVGYSAPSIDGQVDCIRRAHAMSKVQSASISYVEAHGTGTKLGDPIEVQALNEVFGNHNGQKCALGSVKSNIGHTGTAAGVAGFIKTVLALKYKSLPPSLHYNNANPEVPFQAGPFYVVNRLTDWKSVNGEKLRAGVSSFGIGGTNTHVVLEEAPDLMSAKDTKTSLFNLSGMNFSSVLACKEEVMKWMDSNPDINLSDVAHTLQKGRKHFDFRIAVAASTVDELKDKLFSRKPAANKGQHQNVYFMCSGQGSQYFGMTKDLYNEHPLFKEWIDKGLTLAEELTNIKFREILFDNDDGKEQINELKNSLPLMFIVEHAIAQLLFSYGIKPTRLIGHSSGEYVAACLSKIFSFEDGLKVVIKRSQLMQSAEEGMMLSVPLSEHELFPMLGKKLSLTAVNTNSQCVVGGKELDIKEFKYKLEGLGYDCKELKASHAAHSFLMESILPDFEKMLNEVHFNAPTIPVISNFTGKELTAEQAQSPNYWCDHLRNTVRFADGISELLKTSNSVFIEIGPGQSLCTFVRQHMAKKDQVIVSSIRHPKNPVNDFSYFMDLLAGLWENGLNVDFSKFSTEGRRKISLPGYQFDQIKYPVVADMKTIQEAFGFSGVGQDQTDGKELNLYTETWKQAIPVETLAIQQPQDWVIIITENGSWSDALKTYMSSHYNTVIFAERADVTEKLNATHIKFDKYAPEKYRELFQQIGKLDGEGRIIYSSPDLFHTNVLVKNSSDVSENFFDFADLVKVIDNLQQEYSIALDVITEGVHQVSGIEKIIPENALIYGAYKVLRQECLSLKMRFIDVTDNNVSAYNNVLSEIQGTATDELIALRNNKRWIRSIERLPVKQLKESYSFKKNGFAILTGAPGGMATVLAEHFATVHQMKIGLIGRSPLPEAYVAHLKSLNIDYSFELADVSNAAQMKRAFENLTKQYGINVDICVHAAGLGDYAGLLAGRKREDSVEVLAPKVEGSAIVMAELEKYTIGTIIFCSSRATEIAPVGQIAYIAGNEYQNAAAKKSSTAKIISIGWEAWKEIGMAIKSKDKAGKDDAHLENALTNAEAIQVLNMALLTGQPHVIVSRKSLPVMIADYKKRLEVIATKDENTSLAVISRSNLKSEHIEPKNEIEKKLQGLWSDFFGIENIGTEDDFFELGGDSLKLMRMHRIICASFNIKFELVELFIHFKIRTIANFLIQSDLVRLEVQVEKTIETIKF